MSRPIFDCRRIVLGKYGRLDAHPTVDNEYSIQKPFRTQELIGQLYEILLDQTYQ
jgi:hypothetical protein